MERQRPIAPLGGRYVVDGFLRPGRFGDLWLAHPAGAPEEPAESTVAVKLLRPELFKDGEAIRRFQREVRLLLSFEHPHLLRVLDSGTTDGGDPFVVVEHVEGRLLSDVVDREAPLPLDRVRAIGTPIARVLAAAAARGIVHRGLSPDAILVGPDDGVKVFDFGFAIVFRGEPEPLAGPVGPGHGLDTDSARLTEHGQRLGDPLYMAPEYIAAFESDARSDLYALGVLLYELATGDPPFRGRAMDVLDAHVSASPEPPSRRVPGLPGWFDTLVMALLDKDPSARPDGTAVARALAVGTWPPPTEATGPIPG